MMLAGLILFICCFIFALANNVDSKDKPTVYDININELKNNEPIEVESNSIINIIFTGGGYIGWTNVEFDVKAIESTNVIHYLGDSYRRNPDLCNCDPIENLCTCIEDVVSSFYVNVPNNGETPKLKYTRNTTELFHIEVPVKVKPKKCPTSEYKCCSNDEATVKYQDEEGDWSIENNEWCLIDRPKVIRVQCDYHEYGIPCRNINGGKYYCFYSGEYPICNENTKVVYTDTEKWGKENGKWCVMCN